MNKIAIICDPHLPADPTSAQYAFLQQAIDQMKQDRIHTVLSLGDLTSYGQVEAFQKYCTLMQDFTHYDVIGNAEIRDSSTVSTMEAFFKPIRFQYGARTIYGINVSRGIITAEDRDFLKDIQDNDVLFFHHGPDRLDEESTVWLRSLCEEKALLLLHGHRHKDEDRYIGRTRAVGFRGLDPDKAIGGYPCIHYLCFSCDAGTNDTRVTFEEHAFPVAKETLADFRQFFGLSCVDNYRDVLYATEHSIKYIELRCNGKNWVPDEVLLPVIDKWRETTGGYLSVHMPNLRFKDGEFVGKKQFQDALAYAKLVQADGLTIHPPRVKISDMPEGGALWQEMLEQYVATVKVMPEHVRIGIENVHIEKGDDIGADRPFGVIPDDICRWIAAIDEAAGIPGRIGHVQDVGHARNNGKFASIYPVGRWQKLIGNKTVAYHIHQTVLTEDGLKNHKPLTEWFGPVINYTSFMYNWEQGVLNHVPAFLEVKGCDNFAMSVDAFEKLMHTTDS